MRARPLSLALFGLGLPLSVGLQTLGWEALLPRAAAQSPPPAEAAAPVKLEYAFERLHGKTALYELETEQVVSQEVRGLQAGRENQPEALRGEVRTRVVELQAWRFSRGEEGGGRIEIEVGQVVVTLEEQGKRARTFTSDRPRRAPERLRPLLEKAGHKLTLVVSRNGALRAVEGVEQGAAREQSGVLLELPAEPLAPGAGWDRLDPRPMPPLGTMNYHFHYRLGAVEPARRRLEVSIRAELETSPEPGSYHTELSGQEGRGWLVLDPDGLVQESLLESRLELTIKSAEGTQVQRLRNKTRQVLKETR